MSRPFTTVQIRQNPTDRNLLAWFCLYSSTDTIAFWDGKSETSRVVTESQFHEWFSFSLYLGLSITVAVRDSEMQCRNIATF